MPRRPRGLNLGSPQASPIAQGIESFGNAFSPANVVGVLLKRQAQEDKEKLAELTKRKQDLEVAEKLIATLKEKDPATRKLLFDTYFADLGGDPTSDRGKQIFKFFSTVGDEAREKLIGSLSTAGKNAPPGAVASMVSALAQGDVTLVEALKRLEGLSQKGAVKGAIQASQPGFQQTGGAGGTQQVRQRALAPPGQDGGFEKQAKLLETAGGRLIDAGNIEAANSVYDTLTKLKAAAKPEAAQSKIGKQIADLRKAEGEFGRDSFEAKAIRDSVSQLSGGPRATISETSTMRAQFIGASKTYREALTAFREIGEIMKTGGSPANDLALVTALVRITQPGGKISDADYRQAAAIGSYGQRIRQWYEQATTGEGLLPEQRRDIQRLSHSIFTARQSNQRQLEKQFGALAARNRVDPRNVVLDFEGGGTSKKVDVRGLTPAKIAKMSNKDAKSLLLLPEGVLTEPQLRALEAKMGLR